MIRVAQRQISAGAAVFAAVLWMVLLCNVSFFSNVFDSYPASPGNIAFVVSLGVLLVALLMLLMVPFSETRAMKPLLIVSLLLASMTAYFMDSYHVIVSTELVSSAVQTDSSETLGLLNLKLAIYLVFLGVLPAILLYRIPVRRRKFAAALVAQLKLLAVSLFTIILVLLSFNSAYASFFREHKPLRFYANPIAPIYAVVKYADEQWGSERSLPFQQIAPDAKQVSAAGKRKLVVLVVGETARADHFSLNGYAVPTNPRLSQMGVTSFDNVWSCGTATAISVPCMFSVLDRAHYGEQRARSTENVLDILQRAGVNVAWLDNNSDSKGVALRVPYINYRDRANNSVCDVECRDEGMLEGARKYIAEHPEGDILMVLHQMGSHGPEYAKRYPSRFNHFSPSCHSNLLENCSEEEIRNAYDNSILYTDYFLSEVIGYLNSVSDDFSPAMIYLSDHGESLGENGIFLHGFPYALAPDAQKHVPMIFWSGEGYGREQAKTAGKGFTHREFSHDYLFHTLLGLMAVDTKIYQPELDIFANG
ncbi:phosphoethanolamine transferase [uncultured Microbulbifer sp.]|uniref:phosphoethanolamine transferase n=1 Tax=uncultured Microbulbifer sp. TaxID=348147 RepID=UPI0025E932A0|nr:phosphoethanolamine--lipid A transferase [uncultured Microbulbifer sp.]